jgi:hypothetical protein
MTTSPRTLTCAFTPRTRRRGSRPALPPDRAAAAAAPPAGRVPRVARLLALALRWDQLVRDGRIASYAELAALGQVSRARITQIMNLLLLAPDIQEHLLFATRPERGRDPIPLGQLQPLARIPDWGEQRRLWQALQHAVHSKQQSGPSLPLNGCSVANAGTAAGCFPGTLYRVSPESVRCAQQEGDPC